MARIRTIKPDNWPNSNLAWGHSRCNLYLIQEGEDGPCKVGIAGHPIRRLSTLQCGNYRRLYLRSVYAGTEANCREIEKYLLRYFERAGGEWLHVDVDDVRSFLRAFEEVE